MGLSDYLGGPALPELVKLAGPEAVLRAVIKALEPRLYYISDDRKKVAQLHRDLTKIVEKYFDNHA